MQYDLTAKPYILTCQCAVCTLYHILYKNTIYSVNYYGLYLMTKVTSVSPQYINENKFCLQFAFYGLQTLCFRALFIKKYLSDTIFSNIAKSRKIH